MIKFEHLLFFFLLLPISLKGQKYAQHSIFVEGLGSGGLYSINYDRILFDNDNLYYSLRGGIGVTYPDTSNSHLGSPSHILEYRIPIMLNRISGKKRNHFEMGMGMLIKRGYDKEKDKYYSKSPKIEIALAGFLGYRFQKQSQGLFLRFGFTPVYVISTSELIPWLGLGFGYSF